MARRLELQTELEQLLGSEYVYFQPPESIKLHYPCIIYNKENWSIRYANNFPYKMHPNYEITIIDRDPDADWDKKMLRTFTYVSVERFFAVDNLYHWVFRLYY